MHKFTKRQTLVGFTIFLLGLPIVVQAAAPPLRVCGGIILIEEEENEIEAENIPVTIPHEMP